jgi:hypothetical protein
MREARRAALGESPQDSCFIREQRSVAGVAVRDLVLQDSGCAQTIDYVRPKP